MKAQYFHLSVLVLSIILILSLLFLSTFQILIELNHIAIFCFLWLIIACTDFYLYITKIYQSIKELYEIVERLKNTTKAPMIYNSKKSLADILNQLINYQSRIEIMKKEAEISALQSQINPHFLYNTLETIRGQALYAGVQDIAKTTKALADIFRYSIGKSGTMIVLKEEIENIDSYIQIQQIRFDNRFTVVKDIDEDVLYIKIPKLIVQPIIENAFKHGLEKKIDGGNISIQAYRTVHELTIIVKDDGNGMTSETLLELNNAFYSNLEIRMDESIKSNIGLSNINSRIKLIYGENYGVFVSSAIGIGTTVTLRLGIFNS